MDKPPMQKMNAKPMSGGLGLTKQNATLTDKPPKYTMNTNPFVQPPMQTMNASSMMGQPSYIP